MLHEDSVEWKKGEFQEMQDKHLWRKQQLIE